MRSLAFAALSAAFLFACGDDDGGDDNDDGNKDGSVEAGAIDGGRDGGLDASRDGSLDASAATRAVATLASKSGSSVTGEATFQEVNGVVTLTLTIQGATPGQHGVHIHVNDDCSDANAASAGGHWNPGMRPHGSGSRDAGAASHLGDLGNILIASNGQGTLTVSKAEWSLGTGEQTDVIGHAIVFHANQDDFVTQEGQSDAGPGNSGGRQACGEIEAD